MIMRSVRGWYRRERLRQLALLEGAPRPNRNIRHSRRGTFYFSPPQQFQIQGRLVWEVGPAGSDYPITAYGNSFGKAWNQALNDINVNGATHDPAAILAIGMGAWSLDVQAIWQNQYTMVRGAGRTVTIINLAAGAFANAADCIVGGGNGSTNLFDWKGGELVDITFDATNYATTAITGIPASGTYVYTHGTSGGTPAPKAAFVFFTAGAAASYVYQPVFPTSSPSQTLAALPARGMFMRIGDTLTLTTISVQPVAGYASINAICNFTPKDGPASGNETGSPFYIRRCVFRNVSGVTFSFIMDGNEDGCIEDTEVRSNSFGSYITWSGSSRFFGGKMAGVLAGGLTVLLVEVTVGNMGFEWTASGPASSSNTTNLTFVNCFINGTTTVFSAIHVTIPSGAGSDPTVNAIANDIGSWWSGGLAGVDANINTFVNGAGIGQVLAWNFDGPTITQGQIANHPTFFPAVNSVKAAGLVLMVIQANFLAADFVNSMNYTGMIIRGGTVTIYVNGFLSNGAPFRVGSDSRSVTAADVSAINLLPANTTVLTGFLATLVIECQAYNATTGTVSYTLAWTDQDSQARTAVITVNALHGTAQVTQPIIAKSGTQVTIQMTSSGTWTSTTVRAICSLHQVVP